MIILDTNVLSELMRSSPEVAVTRWVGQQSASSLHLTSITQAEILHGIALLPAGRRRKSLETAAWAMFKEDFSGRVLPFDSQAAPWYAQLAAQRAAAGQPISQFDAQIAAIARAAGARLATRNTRDFLGCDVELVDPWTYNPGQ